MKALAEGVAEWLNDSALGTWPPSGDYWPIYIQSSPAAPARTLVVTPYPVDDDPEFGDSVVGIQIKATSANREEVLDEMDNVFSQLQGITNTEFGGVFVLIATRQSGAIMGPDGNGRFTRSENYYFLVHYPTARRS